VNTRTPEDSEGPLLEAPITVTQPDVNDDEMLLDREEILEPLDTIPAEPTLNTEPTPDPAPPSGPPSAAPSAPPFGLEAEHSLEETPTPLDNDAAPATASTEEQAQTEEGGFEDLLGSLEDHLDASGPEQVKVEVSAPTEIPAAAPEAAPEAAEAEAEAVKSEETAEQPATEAEGTVVEEQIPEAVGPEAA